MKRLISAMVVAVGMIVSSAALATNITVASWNVKRLGQEQHSYKALAAVASHADLIALEEVMNGEAVETFRQALEQQTREKWSVMSSHLIGSDRYKEMYSFLYRNSAVEYLDGAVVYTDRGNRFFREPFSARFRTRDDGTVFALAGVHILYGKSEDDRLPEIKALADYWKWMESIYPGTPLMLVGDFNMPPTHPAWASLSAYAMPLIRKGGSTLGGAGRYVNLYDNIWVSRKRDLPLASAGIIDYPKLLGWSHEQSRAEVSDHAPVFVTLGTKRLDSNIALVQPDQASAQPAQAQPRQGVGLSMMSSASAMLSNAADGVRGMMGGGDAGRVSDPVRGNSNTMIYHRKDCPFYDRIGAKNRVEFKSPAEAEHAGYKLAGNCP